MRMLKMDFLRAPPMRDLVEHNLDHLRSGVVDPRDAAVIVAGIAIDRFDGTIVGQQLEEVTE